MNVFKKLSRMWETRQQPSILCDSEELLRHINFWVRYEDLNCGLYSLLMSVPFVRDDFLTAHHYDRENNTFEVTTGTLGDKSAVIVLLPHKVIICPKEDQGKDFHYRIVSQERVYNGRPYVENRLVEVN